MVLNCTKKALCALVTKITRVKHLLRRVTKQAYALTQNALLAGVLYFKRGVNVLTVTNCWIHVRRHNIAIIRPAAPMADVKTSLLTDVLTEKVIPPMTIMIYVYVGQMQMGANFARKVNTVTTINTCVRIYQTRRVKIQTGCLPMATQHVYV